MIINAANMRTLYTGFSAAFQGALQTAPSFYGRVAMDMPSSTRQNEYGWLAMFPRIREWIGERVVNSIKVESYVIRNRRFESTVDVLQDDIDDDNLGIYTPMFQELGRAVATFPDELIFPLLTNGWSGVGYDGRPFFDTQHPVLGADGSTIVSVSNSGGGAGTPWYLLDTTRAVKPLIYQRRRDFELRRMDATTDEIMFREGRARYGVDGRCNAGYGLWQLAYGSRQTLDDTNYAAARAAMMALPGDHGRPLNIRPNLLVVPPSLEAAALRILNAETNASGATNVWRNTAELLVVPWLAF
jgi:phage major head subunit gpT-like protein